VRPFAEIVFSIGVLVFVSLPVSCVVFVSCPLFGALLYSLESKLSR